MRQVAADGATAFGPEAQREQPLRAARRLGLEDVTADGEVWNGLRGLRKDNTGYDLKQFFIGSEGTLGIITAATLKLYPQPAAQMTAFAAVPSAFAALQLFELAQRRLAATLTAFELLDAECVAFWALPGSLLSSST